MNEVYEASQILLVTGRGAYVLGNITLKAALSVLKILNTLYLAKWKGKVSMNRMRHIKGDDFQFINIGTEDKSKLKYIEKEMKAHGILFAKLPDLCGGDGRTQYVIPPSDAAKFKAFLLDHANGPLKDIKVGPISAADYARTGMDSRGNPTPEMTSLTESAIKEFGKKKVQKQAASGAKDGIYMGALSIEQAKQMPAIVYALEKHDKVQTYKEQVSWLEREPIRKHEKWGMYLMPNGADAVIIPREDMTEKLKNPTNGNNIPAQIAIYDSKQYIVVNIVSGEQKTSKGSDIRRQMQTPDLKTRDQQERNLEKHKGQHAKEQETGKVVRKKPESRG